MRMPNKGDLADLVFVTLVILAIPIAALSSFWWVPKITGEELPGLTSADYQATATAKQNNRPEIEFPEGWPHDSDGD